MQHLGEPKKLCYCLHTPKRRGDCDSATYGWTVTADMPVAADNIGIGRVAPDLHPTYAQRRSPGSLPARSKSLAVSESRAGRVPVANLQNSQQRKDP